MRFARAALAAAAVCAVGDASRTGRPPSGPERVRPAAVAGPRLTGGAGAGASLLEAALPAGSARRAVARPAAALAAAGAAALFGGEEARTATESIWSRWPKAWQEELDPNVDYRFSPVGREAFFTTRFRDTGAKVRLKEVLPSTASEWSDARAEVEILRLVQGPGVVALYDAANLTTWHGFTSICMLMEFNDGNVYDNVIEKASSVSFETKVQLMADLLRALERTARAGVVHRDVSPRSLRVFGNCTAPEGCRLKLGCFGSACTQDGGLRPCDAARHLTPRPYTAPEVAGHASPDPKHDVWGAGLVFYVMLFGSLPLAVIGHAPGFVVADHHLAWLHQQKPQLARLLDAMLAADASERYTAAEALSELRRFAAEQGIAVAIDAEAEEAAAAGTE